MKAVVWDRFGEPAEVLQVRELPVPEPGPGQVRVRMIASPINPSDMLTVRGQYGRLPQLPATPGFEGVGVVDKAGPGLLGRFRVGKRVAVLNDRTGNWAEYTIVPARQVVPVPPDIPDDQVASFFVNPATVLAMIRHVLRVPRGAWLLQTAAGGALGRMVIRLGRHDGFKTLNVVRRREQANELKQLGADAVLCTDDGPLPDQVRRMTGSDGVLYALDPVGGPLGSAVVEALAPFGRVLVYGRLTIEPLVVPPRTLIWGNTAVEGFWLTNWVRRQSVLSMLRLFGQIKRLLRAGVLTTAVADEFPLTDVQTAVRRAEETGRAGKVLLRMGT